MNLISLPYTKNVIPVFNQIAEHDFSIWLDSGIERNKEQRYDIISAQPYKTITSTLDYTIVRRISYDDNNNKIHNSFNKTYHSLLNPFDIIEQELSNLNKNSYSNHNCNIPFWHGVLGYFGYDLNQILYKQLQKQQSNNKIPLLAVGLYAWAYISDHVEEKSYIAYDPDFIQPVNIERIMETLLSSKIDILDSDKNHELNRFFEKNNFETLVNYNQYQTNYNIIQDNIKKGNCYQINYTIPFKLKTQNNATSWQVYQYLKQYNNNPFNCYFKINKDLTILSFSPERFIKTSNNLVLTQPIKGTRPNVPNDIVLNTKYKEELSNSTKDLAENLMITDLLRNDLNKFCVPGSVNTSEIAKLYTFPTVHHLVSTINGKLDSKYNSFDLFKNSFPGGSITGAPKLSAMKIIQQVENNTDFLHRYIYCGCIGYININYNMDMNIAIRTLVKYKNYYYYWAGGGIVADSNCQDEYSEIINKLIKTKPKEEN